MTDVSAAAVKQRAAEQLSAATSDMVTQGNIEVPPPQRASPAELPPRLALLARAKQ